MRASRATRYSGVYKTGKATFRYVLDLDPVNGKRRQESRGGYRSAEDAHKARTARLAELHRGIATDPSRQTVGEYLADWLSVRAHSVRPSTQRTYRVLIEHSIVPYLGALPLPKLLPSHIRVWHAALGKVQAPSSVRQAHVLLSSALRSAVNDGALPRNVATLVSPPQPPKAARTAWTLDEVAAFLSVADQEPDAALWRVAVLTGLRAGELLALRWDDVDLRASTLTVRNTVTTDARGRFMVGPAKSESSQATLELDSTCVKALQAQRRRVAEMQLAARYWDDTFVFPRADGRPLAATSVSRRLAQLCAAAGVPVVTMHALRRTCGSLLFDAGVDLKIVQERLRHARLAITESIYVQVYEGRQRHAAEQLAAALAVVQDAQRQSSL